jgi:hypothetical protein
MVMVILMKTTMVVVREIEIVTMMRTATMTWKRTGLCVLRERYIETCINM